MDRIFSNPVNFCSCLTVLFRASSLNNDLAVLKLKLLSAEGRTNMWCLGVYQNICKLGGFLALLELAGENVCFCVLILQTKKCMRLPMYDWCFYLSVCCSVSNWSVLVLRKRGGREGAGLIPLCPVVYPAIPGRVTHEVPCSTRWCTPLYHLWPSTPCDVEHPFPLLLLNCFQ